MSVFKVIMNYSDGQSEELDEVFDSETEAEEHGLYMCSCCSEGAEILNMSNPGDYPLEQAVTAEFEIIEIDD